MAAMGHYRGPYHIENRLLICIANQWTDFNMIGTSVMKELRKVLRYVLQAPYRVVVSLWVL